MDEQARKAPLSDFSTLSDVAQQNHSTGDGHVRNKTIKNLKLCRNLFIKIDAIVFAATGRVAAVPSHDESNIKHSLPRPRSEFD